MPMTRDTLNRTCRKQASDEKASYGTNKTATPVKEELLKCKGDTIRRSGRHRTISSRLQDNHFVYSSVKKRPNTEVTEENTKKPKLEKTDKVVGKRSCNDIVDAGSQKDTDSSEKSKIKVTEREAVSLIPKDVSKERVLKTPPTITGKTGTRTARKGEPVKGITKTSDVNAAKVKRTNEENDELVVSGPSTIKEGSEGIQQAQKMKDRTGIKVTNNEKESLVQVKGEAIIGKGDKDQNRNNEVNKEFKLRHSTNLKDTQLSPVSTEEQTEVKVNKEPEVKCVQNHEDKSVNVSKIDSASEEEKDLAMNVPELNSGETVKHKENEEASNKPICSSAVEQEPGVRYVAVVKSEDPSTVKTAEDTASSIQIKTVSVTSPKESESEDLQNTAKVIMHLRSGDIIHVTEDQIGLDLVKLFEKGNAQVTEVQKLPSGLAYYALEESADENQEPEKASSLQSKTVPNTDKLGLLGPVLNMQGLLECPYCDYTTDKKANWYKHKKRHSGIKRYECDKCSYKAATSSNLKRHYAIHMDLRQFMCSICEQTFRQKIHLERHIKYKHEMKQIKCGLCDYMCSNYNPDLKLHMKRQHQLDGDLTCRESLACEQCNFVGNRRKDLRQHMKFHRPGPEVKLFCELCSFITDCESRLTRHMLVHTNEKPFACGLCHYKATQREHVVRHMITVHKVQPERSTKARKKKREEISTDTNMEDVCEKNVDDDCNGERTEVSKEQTITSEQEKDEENKVETHETKDGQDVTTEEGIDPAKDESMNTEESERKNTEKETSSTEIAIKVIVKQDGDFSVKAEHETEGKESENGESPQKSKAPESCNQQGDYVETTLKPTPITIAHQTDSISTCGREGIADPNQQKEHSIFTKKIRLPATYRNPNREKLFACSYCTMKFAKAINLYKHLKIQHRDVQPVEDGYHGCVLCEYKTTKRKNLLVHLRKHNAWPLATPEYYHQQPAELYSCMMCDYKDPVRKNLYDHWRIQHKIQVILRPDGTAKCVLNDREIELVDYHEEASEASLQIALDGGQVQLQQNQQELVTSSSTEGGSQSSIPDANVMKMSGDTQVSNGRFGSMAYDAVATTGAEQMPSGRKTVMLMMEPGMPATPVQINLPSHSNNSTTSTTHASEADMLTDAAESLQALAGVVESAAAVPMERETATEILEQTQHVEENNETQAVSEHLHNENLNDNVVTEESEVHLTSEELMNLEAGDYIEINGETYKVEFQNS